MNKILHYENRLIGQLWSIGALPILLNSVLIISLINCNWYTDDQETLVRGQYLEDLYITQWSVHFPLLSLISAAIHFVFGQSWLVNRLMVLFANVAIIWCTQRAINRWQLIVETNSVKSLLFQLIYFSPFLVFITNSNAFTNVTALWVAVFLSCIVNLLDYEETDNKIKVKSYFILGIFAACVGLTRVVSAMHVAMLVLFLLSCQTLSIKNIFKIICGVAAACAPVIIWLIVTGKFDSFLFWTLSHNINIKRNLSLIGYFGIPVVPQVFFFWLFMLISAFVLKKNYSNALIKMAFVGFVGGIFAANPSGINTSLQHALPTFPFLILLMCLSLQYCDHAYKKGYLSMLFIGCAVCAILTVRYITRNDVGELRNELISDAKLIKSKTKPTDKIMLLGVNPIIYHYANRKSGSFASILLPDLAFYKDQILRDAFRDEVVCFYIEDYGPWYEANDRSFSELYEYAFSRRVRLNERIYCK